MDPGLLHPSWRDRLVDAVRSHIAHRVWDLPPLSGLMSDASVPRNEAWAVLRAAAGPFGIEDRGEDGIRLLPPDVFEAEDQAPPEVRTLEARTGVDGTYSPLPEEARGAGGDAAGGIGVVLVAGRLQRLVDPTGVTGARFQLFLQLRQTLQSMGVGTTWVPLSHDHRGEVEQEGLRDFQMQAASLGGHLRGVVLLDPGYGRKVPLWKVATEAVEAPVVWFHSAPLHPELQPSGLPSNAHLLEPDWSAAGQALLDHLLSHLRPQEVLFLSPPGEDWLPPHLEVVREGLARSWGTRWIRVLGWSQVFRERVAARCSGVHGRLRRAFQDLGVVPHDLEFLFAAARVHDARLWLCADDLLALAASDWLDATCSDRHDARPGVFGFGNHPMSLVRGLATVDLSWATVLERAMATLTGLGRRNRSARYLVLPGPSAHPLDGAVLRG